MPPAPATGPIGSIQVAAALPLSIHIILLIYIIPARPLVIVFNWRRTRMPYPLFTYSKASLQDTTGLIQSDVSRATIHQVLVHVTTHSLAHCMLPALEHHAWQPDQSFTNVWMSRVRKSPVVVHQFGTRCKPGCPVSSSRTTQFALYHSGLEVYQLKSSVACHLQVAQIPRDRCQSVIL